MAQALLDQRKLLSLLQEVYDTVYEWSGEMAYCTFGCQGEQGSIPHEPGCLLNRIAQVLKEAKEDKDDQKLA